MQEDSKQTVNFKHTFPVVGVLVNTSLYITKLISYWVYKGEAINQFNRAITAFLCEDRRQFCRYVKRQVIFLILHWRFGVKKLTKTNAEIFCCSNSLFFVSIQFYILNFRFRVHTKSIQKKQVTTHFLLVFTTKETLWFILVRKLFILAQNPYQTRTLSASQNL